jgi:tRNA-Thr(GGU) m(6)t(6)A37 methyltransferase TsaA
MSASSTFGVLLGVVSILSWEMVKLVKKKNKYKQAYWGERKGRTRVEREMKKIANIRLNTDEGFFVQPVGIITSFYRQCVGTPRQGLLVPVSRSRITLTRNVSPESLEGLQDFSHVWITFQFHMNTNVLKESKAFTGSSTFNAKISLPVLKGGKVKKLGVFATRSPHRPNPIGVTLAQIRSIDKVKRIVYLQACDLVEGTPVLDIKPYVPIYDSVPNFRVPEWLVSYVHSRNEVTIHPDVRAQVEKIKSRLCHYKNEPDVFLQAMQETLAAEVRSKFQTLKQMGFTEQGNLVAVLFDETVVRYRWVSERSFEIMEVTLKTMDKKIVETLQILNEATNDFDETIVGGDISDCDNDENDNETQVVA